MANAEEVTIDLSEDRKKAILTDLFENTTWDKPLDDVGIEMEPGWEEEDM